MSEKPAPILLCSDEDQSKDKWNPLLYTSLALCSLFGVTGNHPLQQSMSPPIQMRSQKGLDLTMEMNVSSLVTSLKSIAFGCLRLCEEF